MSKWTEMAERLDKPSRLGLAPDVPTLTEAAALLREADGLGKEISGYDSMLRVANARIAELEAALPSLDWVKTSDRLPDYPDWDEDGYLWGGEPGRTVLIHYADTRLYPYWMPKPRATPPRPPEGE